VNSTTTDEAILARFVDAQDRLVFQASDLSLGTISDMVQSGAIDVRPEYQRRDRWDFDKRSALIESFLLNVPVPAVYLAEEDYGSYSVIDGQQRIWTSHLFLTDEFSLRKLRSFPELNGRSFSSLPEALRNALTIRPAIRATTLLRQSDPTLKYEVFERLNTGGEALNAQEVRNVAFRGQLNDLIYDLAESSFLKRQLKITTPRAAAYKKMQDAEYVLRYLTLEERWRGFSGDLSASMDMFMEAHREGAEPWLSDRANSFRRALEWCERLWGNRAFQRPEGASWRDQALAGMYDAEMIAVSLVSDAQLQAFINKPSATSEPHPLAVVRDLFGDPEFDLSVRTGTNTPRRIVYRIDRLYRELTR
jgi:Protein of unknown function DUF262